VGIRFVCRRQSSADSIPDSRMHLMMADPVHILYIQILSMHRRCRPEIPTHRGALPGFRCFGRRPRFQEMLEEGVIDIPLAQASRCLHLNSRGSSFSARCRHVVPIVNGGSHDYSEVSIPHQTLCACTGSTYYSYPRLPQNYLCRG
jgi:hypothetical protein